jgi:D-3-phosphoglycerate dehydrogenase
VTTDLRRPVVVFTDESIAHEARQALESTCDIRVIGAYASEEATIRATQDADAVLARLGQITERVIAAAPRLRIVACHGSGVDSVDMAAATEHGVVVTNAGPANAASVAEYTFALLLALLRKVPSADSGMRSGGWRRDRQIGISLEGKAIGVVGFGQIGRRVARIALGFGMRVLVADPRAEVPDGMTHASLDSLLREADIVTLHARLTPETAGMIDPWAMRPGSVLVNTARGEIVRESALIDALRANHLAGAALDTYMQEPLPADSPLRSMENVVLSPHVSAQTREAMAAMGLTAAEAILDVLAGRRPRYVRNPEVYEKNGRHGPPSSTIPGGVDPAHSNRGTA